MRGTIRQHWLGGAAGFATLLGCALAAAPLRADPAVTAPEPPTAPTPLDARQLELRGLQDSIDASDAKRKALAEEIARFKDDRAKLTQSLVDTTSKVSTDEQKIADAEARIDKLAAREAATKRSLEGRRAVVAEVLAALQRMGRKPPPALLVEPEDVLKAIRTSMLLGAVLPGMRAETEALVADLSDLTRTRQAIEAEKSAVDADLVALGAERTRLSALVEARQNALGRDERDLDAERDKAKQLAGEAGSLKDLIGRMESDGAAAAKAAEAARRSDETLAMMMPAPNPAGAPAKDPARLAPAIAFVQTKGRLALPASGSILRRYGEDDGLGSTEKGLLLATRPTAIVSAPADGWIVYAGPYRSFGQLLILNVGGGYYIVLAGMERINVDLGQFVSAGEPVAVMGDGSTRTAAAIALGAAQPVLYVEFRKDGASIDPGPWWAKPELQRVRG